MEASALQHAGAAALVTFALACTCGDLDPLPPGEGPPLADPAEGQLPPTGGGPRGPGEDRDRERVGKGKGGKSRPVPEEPVPPPAEPAPADPAPVPGITYKGNDTWEVERSLVSRYEDDPDRLGARVEEHGKGWEVRGVGPEDDAHALGARNGDVIKRINGMPLDTTTDLLLVWAELGNATKLDVQLTRDGETRVHHYKIVR